jgi:hypothetical protein
MLVDYFAGTTETIILTPKKQGKSTIVASVDEPYGLANEAGRPREGRTARQRDTHPARRSRKESHCSGQSGLSHSATHVVRMESAGGV